MDLEGFSGLCVERVTPVKTELRSEYRMQRRSTRLFLYTFPMQDDQNHPEVRVFRKDVADFFINVRKRLSGDELFLIPICDHNG